MATDRRSKSPVASIGTLVTTMTPEISINQTLGWRGQVSEPSGGQSVSQAFTEKL